MQDPPDHVLTGEFDFKHLFIEYYPLLTAFAFKFLKDEDTSKDIVQNVFVKIFQNGLSHIQSDIKYYLYRAVHNECLNEIKKANTRKRYHIQHSEFQDSVYLEKAIEQNEEEQKVARAIDRLPPKCRQIFLMSRFDGRKNPEIAEELNLSVRTVETQISLALKNLRKDLLTVFSFLLPGIL